MYPLQRHSKPDNGTQFMDGLQEQSMENVSITIYGERFNI